MFQNLPIYITFFFVLTTLVTLFLFYKILINSTIAEVRNNSTKILIGLLCWLLIQALLSFTIIYKPDKNSFPPKILLFGVLPTIFTIMILFISNKGRLFIDSLPLQKITFLNTVRIPVELVLFCLFLHNTIPQLMTFEGRNFDILAGISAPFIVYFGFFKNKLNNHFILIWNFICLGLLMNIVITALLSAPSPIQKFAFDQPNIAIFYFPFSWLPTFIVPIVLFGHLVSIRQLLKKEN